MGLLPFSFQNAKFNLLVFLFRKWAPELDFSTRCVAVFPNSFSGNSRGDISVFGPRRIPFRLGQTNVYWTWRQAEYWNWIFEGKIAFTLANLLWKNLKLNLKLNFNNFSIFIIIYCAKKIIFHLKDSNRRPQKPNANALITGSWIKWEYFKNYFFIFIFNFLLF